MKERWILLLLLLTGSAHADMYRWIDASGKVTYSDMPPPASAKHVQQKKPAKHEGEDSALPYSIASVSRDHPVTLYTSGQCTACEEGRAFLNKRGIPFIEKTISTKEDQNALIKAGGQGKTVPHISVGSVQIAGFNSASWNNALTVAGYPETSRLPASYSAPAAQPAASSTAQ